MARCRMMPRPRFRLGRFCAVPKGKEKKWVARCHAASNASVRWLFRARVPAIRRRLLAVSLVHSPSARASVRFVFVTQGHPALFFFRLFVPFRFPKKRKKRHSVRLSSRYFCPRQAWSVLKLRTKGPLQWRDVGVFSAGPRVALALCASVRTLANADRALRKKKISGIFRQNAFSTALTQAPLFSPFV